MDIRHLNEVTRVDMRMCMDIRHLNEVTRVDMRMCMDIRHLNEVTRVDPYPMPQVDDLLDQLDAKYSTAIVGIATFWRLQEGSYGKGVEDHCG